MIHSGVVASSKTIGNPTWVLTRTTPSFQDEVGAVITHQLKCTQARTGAKVRIRISGHRTLSEGYAENWKETLIAAAEAVGCEAESTYGDRVVITIGSSYTSSSIIEWTMNGIADNWTQEHVTFAVGYSQTNYHVEEVVSDVESTIKNNSSSFWLYDSSQDPVGLKKMYFSNLYGNFVDEGLPIRWTLNTENIAVGDKFTIYGGGSADYGFSDFEISFNAALIAAVESAGCTIETGIPQGQGGIITITDSYDEASPIEFEWKTRIDQEEDAPLDENGLPEDMHFFIVDEESIDVNELRVTGAIVSYWINDTSQAPTETRWKIELSHDRPVMNDLISYRLYSDTGVSAGSIDISEVGEGLATFDQSLEDSVITAVASTTGASYSNGTITVDATWGGELVFERTLTNTAETYCGIRLDNPTTSSIVIQTAVCLPNFTPIANSDYLTGVNLSSGEFSSSYVPGTYGTNYVYPAVPESSTDPYKEIDYWHSQGINVIRLPFQWGRIQHDLYGELYDGGFSGTYSGAMDMARIDDIVNTWTGLGHHIVLDMHNYGKFGGDLIGVDDGNVSPLAFYDVWERLAERYKNNPLVIFGIMNEPITQPVQEWSYYAKGCVAAIRATGSRNRVLIPSIDYTGAHNWMGNGSGEVYRDYKDPVGETIFEVHQYLDSYYSGTSDVCQSNAGLLIQDVTDWALDRGVKLFLGEFNGGANTNCQNEIDKLLGVIEDNPAAWLGWTAWGAGTWWSSSYIFFLNPTDYDDPDDESPCWAQIKPWVTI